MQKYFITTIILATLFLTVVGCKSKKAVPEVAPPAGQVTLVLKEGATPESIVQTGPFRVQSKKKIDKKTNEWLVVYDLKKYSRQDLTGYLINLADVISLDGIGKDVTPPIQGSREEIPTKKK